MKDKIDDYKQNLYSRKYRDTSKKDLEKMKKLKQHNIQVENNWESVADRLDKNTDLYRYDRKKINPFVLIFIISFSFFILAAGVAGTFLYFKKNDVPLNRMETTLVAANSVESGKVFSYDFNIENNTKFDFKDISVYIKYPDGVVDPDTNELKDSDEVDIDELKHGVAQKIRKKIILYGEPEEKKDIKISVDYLIKGYSVLLNQKKEFFVKMETSPVFVKVKAPKDIMVDKEFNVDVEVSSNSNTTLKNVVLIATYPNGFNIVNYDPEAIFHTENKNIFLIPEIKVGEKKVIHLKAKLKGNNGDKKVLNFLVGSTKKGSENEIGIKYFKVQESILIKRPSLDLALKCNADTDADGNYIVNAQSDLECKYTLSNNLTSKITNLGIKLFYPDNLIVEDKNMARNGYIDSNNNQILWNTDTDKEDFSVLKGGDSIEGDFRFRIKNIDDLAGYVKNPTMKLRFVLSGMNFNNDNKIGKIETEKNQLVKLNSNVKFITETHYKKDESSETKWSAWENEGGPTPHVGQKTTYAIKWSIYNSFNRLKDVKVVAKLPLGVKYENLVFPENNYVIYDDKTREIKWLVKKIEPYIGYKTDPKILEFKVSYIPILDELGSTKQLVLNPTLLARDTFTGKDLIIKSKNNSTRIFGEGFKYDIGVVQK